ncbi:MAG TPA: hypothetical protein ENJ80_00015 [Gammaproteobacteria bacterium]|nr:hypothetical protein [Gammaproteobacteria bacterium]
MHQASDIQELLAPLRPRLKRGLQLQSQIHAGKTWYVLGDPLNGRHYRFSPAAQRVLEMLDGKRSLAEIAAVPGGDVTETSAHFEQLLGLLARLYAAELLDWKLSPQQRAVFDHLSGKTAGQAPPRRPFNPLAIRLPLADPDALLQRLLPFVRPLFSPLWLLAWCLLVGWGLLQAAMNLDALAGELGDRLLTSSNLLLLWLSYPLVKLLHELGHAFAVKVRGGEVHEMGVMLLALIPVPYVDASAASGFPERRWRLLVGAAGMLVDLAVASLALAVWLSVSPDSWLHALCYNIMLIAGVSTLLFNLNPLMRYDGYYMLADLTGIPNLSSRASRYLLYLLQRHAFGLRTGKSPATGAGEARWLLLYGLAAFVYRVAILGVILWLVSERYFLLGLVIAVWGGWMMFIAPLLRGLHALWRGPELAPVRTRAIAVSSAAAVFAAVFLFVVPVPSWTQAEAVVWLPERAVLRAGADGFVSELLVEPGAQVQAGSALIRSEDPLAQVRIKRQQAYVEELRHRYTAARSRDRNEAARVRDELETARGDLERARKRLAALTLYSAADGRFEPLRGRDIEGRFVRQGQVLGYVVGSVQPTLRAVVGQDDIGRVRSDAGNIRARLGESTDRLLPLRLVRAVPAANRRLPSAALGTAGGGAVPVDPADATGRTALTQVFEVELALPPGVRAHPGARARVRFEHSAAPLGQRWYRSLMTAIDRRLAG